MNMLLLALPVLVLVAVIVSSRRTFPRQHRDCYPSRPMDNREKRASWAMKHYLSEDAMPNNFGWNFKSHIHKHGTGVAHE